MSSIEALDITNVENPQEQGESLLEGNLDIIKDVKVKLEVRVGEAELTVDQLMNLAKDSIVPIERLTSEPIDILLDGKVVARGHLVAADDNFGIQVSEINN